MPSAMRQKVSGADPAQRPARSSPSLPPSWQVDTVRRKLFASALRRALPMKRGLAAKLSWVLLRGQCANGALGADGSALKVLESLVRLPALELKL